MLARRPAGNYARLMRSRDSDPPPETEVEIELDPVDVRHPGADAVESGGPRSGLPGRLRTPAATVVLAVVVAAVVGYVIGDRGAKARNPRPAASVSTAVTVPPPLTGADAVTGTGGRCAVQNGTRLTLGVEIRNGTTSAAILRPPRVILPLGGLRLRSVTWGSCAQISPMTEADDRVVPAGGTVWLSMVFDVLVACPAPMPVQLHVGYTLSNGSGEADLLPFPDLGDVPYRDPRCPSGS